MPSSTGPNLGLKSGWSTGEHGWAAEFNANLRQLDAFVQLAVLGLQNDPPADPSNGDRYIAGDTPTGSWAGEAKSIAIYETSGWVFHAPKAGWRCINLGDGDKDLYYTGAAWAEKAIGGATPESDHTTIIKNFAYGDATPVDLAEIAAGKRIFEVWLTVETAFDGVGAALSVGDAVDNERFIPGAYVDATQVGSTCTHPWYSYGTDTMVKLYITPGTDPSAGSGAVMLVVES